MKDVLLRIYTHSNSHAFGAVTSSPSPVYSWLAPLSVHNPWQVSRAYLLKQPVVKDVHSNSHAFGAVAYDLNLLLLAPLPVHQPSEVSKMQHIVDTLQHPLPHTYHCSMQQVPASKTPVR